MIVPTSTAPVLDSTTIAVILRGEMARPSVFIGSSVEGLQFARAVRFLLKDDAEITLWNEDFFQLGHTYIETLVNSLPRFDFAVLVLSSDDLVTSRNDETFSPRDNVIFELGLFMGHLGRSRTFIVHQRNAAIKVPSDLSGVTTATYEWPREDNSREGALGAACDRIRNVIRDLGVSEAKTAKAISNIELRQNEQAQQIKLLRFFIANFIGKWELKHLEGLEKGRPYPFDHVIPTFEEELVRLRSFRLIDHIEGKGIVAMKQEGQGDLNDHFRITDLGKEYLKLRQEVVSEVKESVESTGE